jgi:hypothetical protein
VEVEARIRKVLDSTTTPSPGTVPDHLRRGVTSVRVSTFVILSFHCPCDLAQGLGCGGSEPWGADPPMDASRWEARHASNGVTWVCEERERERERLAYRQSGSKETGDEGPYWIRILQRGGDRMGVALPPCLCLVWPFLCLKARLPC